MVDIKLYPLASILFSEFDKENQRTDSTITTILSHHVLRSNVIVLLSRRTTPRKATCTGDEQRFHEAKRKFVTTSSCVFTARNSPPTQQRGQRGSLRRARVGVRA